MPLSRSSRQPEAFAVAAIAFELPLEPYLGFGATEAPVVEEVHLGVGHHRGHEVDVLRGHLSQTQPGSFQDDSNR